MLYIVPVLVDKSRRDLWDFTNFRMADAITLLRYGMISFSTKQQLTCTVLSHDATRRQLST